MCKSRLPLFLTEGGVTVYATTRPEFRDGRWRIEANRVDSGARHGWLVVSRLTPRNDLASEIASMCSVR